MERDEDDISIAISSIPTPHNIQCGDAKIRVGCNLYTSLLRIREELKAVTLFADALSIDQTQSPHSRIERAPQIGLMGIIYRQASVVCVSLGDQDDGAERCLADLELLSKLTADSFQAIKAGELTLDEATGGIVDDHGEFQRTFWNHFIALCSRKWWKRVCVVQELSVAREVYFLVDESTCAWSTIWDGTIALNDIANISRPTMYHDRAHDIAHSARYALIDFGGHLQTLTYIRANFQEGQKVELARILSNTIDLRCRILHDHIFGLLGLCTDSHASIVVDYQTAYTDLLWQVSLYLLKERQIGEMLYRLSHKDDGPRSSREISPDAKHLHHLDFDTVVTIPSRDLFNLYNAGGFETICQCDEQLRLLWLRGHDLGVISVLSSPWLSGVGDYFTTADLYDWMMEGARLVTEFNKNPESTQTPFRALDYKEMWVTMRAGLSPSRAELSSMTQSLHDWLDANTPIDNEAGVKGLNSQAASLVGQLSTVASKRRFGLTEDGKKCLVPMSAKSGDKVWVIRGCPTPFVFRKRGENWRLVGSAYVHGVMNGEALRNPEDEQDIGVC